MTETETETLLTQADRASRGRATASRGPWHGWRLWMPPVVTFLIAGALWETVATINPYVLPPLGSVASSLVTEPAMYWSNLLVTLQEIVIGAGSGILAGMLLAILMAEFRLLERAIMPLVVVLMVTPVVAIAPALVVAFGFGPGPKYIVTGLVVLFPMLINTLAGLRAVDARALDVLRTLHASRWEIFTRLTFPGSLPYVFAGLRIALPLSVVGATVAEFVAPGQAAGLGSLLTTAAAQADLKVTWAAITLLCLLGIILVSLLAFVRARVLWWAPDEATAS